MNWIAIAIKLAVIIVAAIIANYMFGGSNFGMIAVFAAIGVSGYFMFFDKSLSRSIENFGGGTPALGTRRSEPVVTKSM